MLYVILFVWLLVSALFMLSIPFWFLWLIASEEQRREIADEWPFRWKRWRP